ncbi:hypothetical protein DB346_14860 [Verrucomicrobia bacterium LW23]|nr:hypothetical protein DB346_14860 [Verrucomicrobia bacterium LW23]
MRLTAPHQDDIAMGYFGSKPWRNDKAADWYGALFEEYPLHQKIVATLSDNSTSAEEVRAAATLVIMLGHVFM